MRLGPQLAESYTSPLPPAEVLQRLANVTALTTQTAWWLGLVTTTGKQPFHRYAGTVSEAGFTIRRLQVPGTGWYSGGFRLIFEVQGQAEPAGGGTHLVLRYPVPTALWFAVLLVAVPGASQLTQAGNQPLLLLVKLTGLGPLYWLMHYGIARLEAARWRSELTELLKLQPIG